MTIDPDLCNGKPTIRGKRITAQTIVEFLSAGETEDEILKRNCLPRRLQNRT
ncbi:MAG TPA: DUF433 domain-containing protein [Gammaproteobacteria bacterium]|nr:DUF433 domain-containing protein [Gammaproteobacteria bacterium]